MFASQSGALSGKRDDRVSRPNSQCVFEPLGSNCIQEGQPPFAAAQLRVAYATIPNSAKGALRSLGDSRKAFANERLCRRSPRRRGPRSSSLAILSKFYSDPDLHRQERDKRDQDSSCSRTVCAPIASRHWIRNAAVNPPRLILLAILRSVSCTPIAASFSTRSA